jgi:hypothetical protein
MRFSESILAHDPASVGAPPHREDTAMFEETQEEDKQSSKRGVIIVITVVIVLAIVGTLIYLDSKGALTSSSSSTAATTTGTPVPAGKADPVSDLRILNTKMDKDYTGTTAMWLVDLKNASPTYTYSHIKYETTYGGADNNILGQNQGEIAITIGPGEEQSAQFRDALYPTGTAWFKVKITGAAATQ